MNWMHRYLPLFLFLIIINLIFPAAPTITLNTPENGSSVILDPVLNVTVTGDNNVNVTFWNSGGTTISAGQWASCSILINGSAMCWGDNTYGQIGDGTTTQRNNPVYVNSTGLFISISQANYQQNPHTCGILANGSAMCWGVNTFGQIGDGSTTQRNNPVYVNTTNKFSSITAGNGHTCGILINGSAMCWGNNGNGQLGDGSTTQRENPVYVNAPNAFVSIDGGASYTCGLLSNGSIMCWGINSNGRLGDGTTTQRENPIYTALGYTFTSISTGTSHSCGVLTNGSAMCWGYNYYGQMGNGQSGSTASNPNPLYANTDGLFSSISAGDRHSCGVLVNGSTMCWGENYRSSTSYGMLGDGTITGRSSPVYTDTSNLFSAISAGWTHTCGIVTDGSAMCWGTNSRGGLGDGSTTHRTSPVSVTVSGFNTGILGNSTDIASGSYANMTWTGLQELIRYVWRASVFDGTVNIFSQLWSFSILDSTPPTFTDIGNITGELGTALSYDINGTDAASTVDCFSVNDTTNFQINCSGILENKTGLTVQTYYLNISINDTAANNNSILIWANITDTTPPIFTDIANNTMEYGTSFSYDINATDAASTVDCFTVNDTTNFQINCSGFLENKSVPAVGLYNLNISANDTYNNTNYIPIWINVTDTISPNVSIVYPIGYAAYANLASFNYTAEEPNPDSCWYSTDNGITNSSNVTFGINFTSISLTAGNYNVTIYCNDTSGNVGNDTMRFLIGDYNVNIQISKLTASDPGANENFGRSVGISGDYAIVGALYDSEAASSAGAAYIFVNSGNGQFTEVNKLIASDAQASDDFGWSVAISGDYAIAGAPYEDEDALSGGAAYIFQKNSTGQFEEVNKIMAGDAGTSDNFGRSVGISGDYAIVGSIYNDEKASAAGAAYVFKKNSTGQFELVNKLMASDGQADDHFGKSVSISGDYAIVGADNENNPSPAYSGSGKVYIFKKNSTGQFQEFNSLRPSDAYSSGYFGQAVSISGDYAVAGADITAFSDIVYLLKKNSTGHYTQVNSLSAASAGISSSNSISISGDYAVIGDRNDGTQASGAGAASILMINSTTGALSYLDTIYASDADANDNFGFSASISGNYLIFGAPYDDEAASGAGAAYIFNIYGDRDGPVFTNITNFTLEYGVELAYDINATDATNVSCFRLNDTANFQINCSGYIQNNTFLEIGLYYLNITSNDTIDNNNSIYVWANVSDTTAPNFTNIANNTIEFQTSSLAYDINATDLSNVSCFSVNDTTNFQINCTGYLENKTNLSINLYYLNISVNDTIPNNDSILIWVNVSDTISPSISIQSPTNTSYNFSTIDLNFTYSDLSTISACWYSLDAGVTNTTISSCANTSVAFSNGWKNLSLYINDSSNNLNTSNVSFTVDTISPYIAIDYPTEGVNITSNVSIELNFTVSDAVTGINTSACTYSLDSGSAVAIPNCANTTFNISSNVYGNHNISISVKDNLENQNSSALINFTIANIFGNGSSINTTGFSNLSATIGTSETGGGSMGVSNVSTVNISESGIPVLIFDYNFTSSTLNFSNIIMETGISSSKAYMSVSGINSSYIVNGKTFYLYNASTGYDEVCIRDEKNINYTNITSTCTGTNEYSVTCDGTLQNGYNCTMSGANMTISGLNNSALIQYDTPASSSSSSSSSQTSKSSVITEISQECSGNQNAVTIRITYDSSGVKGLSVTLLGLEGTAFSSQKTTNSNGEAVFKISQGGDYRIITSESSKYYSLSENINLNLLDCGIEELECTEDSDCSENEYCLDGECMEIEQGDCGYIENHEWNNFECCKDEDCGENHFCTHNLCIEKIEPEINTSEQESLESIQELKSMIELAELNLAMEETENPSLNVTTAQSLLEDAKELAAEAQEAHNNGNYMESQQLAEQAKLLVEKAQEIKAEEQKLESDIEETDYSGIIYVIAFVCAVILGYSLLKARKK